MPAVTFSVDYAVKQEQEVVCITGNISSLGSWSPHRAQTMVQTSGTRWTQTITVPDYAKLEYRYAVCSFLHVPESKIVVHHWESNITPRLTELSDKPHSTNTHTYGTYDGQSKIERGWLVDTREMRLMFDKSSLTRLALSLGGSPHACSIRVLAEDATYPQNAISVLVTNLSPEDLSPRQQGEYGEGIETSSDFLTFSTQNLPADHDAKFNVQLLMKSNNSPVKEAKQLKGDNNLVGECCFSSNKLSHSVGSLQLCFSDDTGQTVGQEVTMSYAVLEPLVGASDAHSFQVSYATHWKRRAPALNIGHRGMGRSLTDHSLLKSEGKMVVNIPENTIFSLKEAAHHGADFVEFDVHVTKDGIPVLYHDFQCSLSIKKSEEARRIAISTLPLKDLTVDQLNGIKELQPVILPNGSGTSEFLCEKRETTEEEDALPFGRLQTALEMVPMHCGFDIEIKYPMVCEKSGSEYGGIPMDMNTSVDAILRVVLKYGGGRRIIFSAFNPDVCAMIRLKQSKYPALLANFGKTDLYESYVDPRSRTVENSILTTLSNQLLGLCGHCEDYIAEPGLVEECHKHGLVLMCWGERNVDPVVREMLASIGVDAIIHDRMGSFPRGKKNHFVLAKKK